MFNEVQKNRLFGVGITLGILACVFLAVLSVSFIKGYKYVGRGVYPSNVITVTGTSEVFVVPDTATFTYSVVEEGKTTQEASDKASTKTNKILTAVKNLGVEEKDIQTTGYNVYPKYDYTRTVCPTEPVAMGGSVSYSPCYGGKQIISGYEVSQSMTIKVRKTADAGTILAKVGELGASNVSGIDFVVDNPELAKAEARDKAIADAKDKASKLSKALGVKFDKIVNFYENGDVPVMYNYKTMDSAVMAQGASAPVAPQIQPGQNKVVSNVTITYEVQ